METKFSGKESFEILIFNPFSIKDLLLHEDIDRETNLFNGKKFQVIDFVYYTPDDSLNFSKIKLFPRQLFNFSSKYRNYAQKFRAA